MTTTAPRTRAIPLSDRAGWAAALTGVPHAVAHTWGYNAALQHSVDAPIELFVAETADNRVVCPFTMRTAGPVRDLVTPYGFSGFVGGEAAPLTAAWRRFVEERGYVCGYIGLHPLLAQPSLTESEDTFSHTSVYVLALRLPLAKLHRNLSENRRRQLRSWEAQQGLLTHDRTALTAFFVQHYHSFMCNRNAGPAYAFSEATLRALCGLENVTMVGGLDGQEITAVALFGHTPYGAEYLFNISTPVGQQQSVALIWWGVQYLQALGVPWLNLGGGVRAGDALADFKARFGGENRPLYALKQVYRPELYAELCAAAGVHAANRDGYFPAYHAGGQELMIELDAR